MQNYSKEKLENGVKASDFLKQILKLFFYSIKDSCNKNNDHYFRKN
jgi:hypothetical protein